MIFNLSPLNGVAAFVDRIEKTHPTDVFHRTNKAKGAEGKRSLTVLILESVDEGLMVLGQNVRDALYYHIRTSHEVSREDIPDQLEEFHAALKHLFGPGVEVLETIIAKKIYSKIGLNYEDHDNWTIVDHIKHVKSIGSFFKEIA
jgi:hypothetical protein